MTHRKSPPHQGGEPNGASRALSAATNATNATNVALAGAERRRKAFRAFLDRHGLTPTDLARATGLPTPNAFYNFLGGSAQSLAQVTLERIVNAVPGTTIAELTGLHGRVDVSTLEAAGRRIVLVASVAQAGAWRASWLRSKAEWSSFTVPEGIALPPGDPFGVRVDHPGAEHLYRSGALLLCMPIEGALTGYPDGTHLVIRRERAGRHEVTVRELRHHAGALWLWPGSTHPDHQQPLLFTGEPPTDRERRRNGTLTVMGTVLASWQTTPPPRH